MAKGIRRQLRKAQDRVRKEMAERNESFYGRGLSTEGYAGGYRQALADVELALNGVDPNSRYWHERD